MRRATLIAILLLTATVAAEPVTLVFPDKVSVRIEIAVDGAPVDRAWHDFLERLFRHFDRNGDGKLDAAEVGRMFPLPLPGRRSLPMTFAAMDANKDGAVSLAELKLYCESGGFTPVVTVLEPSTDDDARLAKLLLDELDTNRDGKLSAAEIARFPTLLDKYDRNDEERLRLDDLRKTAKRGGLQSAPEPGIRLGQPAATDAIIRFDFGKSPGISLEAGKSGVTLVADPEGLHRLRGPAANWIASAAPYRRKAILKTNRDFLLAQFDAAASGRPHMTLADIKSDFFLSGLRDLFPFADRDGDDRLTRTELEEYIALVELGVAAQVWIAVRDHGRNPLPLLDADGDGVLDVREIRRAPAVLAGDGDRALPRCFAATFTSPSWPSLGGVAIPAGKSMRPPPKRIAAPAWFIAMDRNGDGYVSPREFLGPPELFRQLDTDGDGLLSPEEASRRP